MKTCKMIGCDETINSVIQKVFTKEIQSISSGGTERTVVVFKYLDELTPEELQTLKPNQIPKQPQFCLYHQKLLNLQTTCTKDAFALNRYGSYPIINSWFKYCSSIEYTTASTKMVENKRKELKKRYPQKT